MDRITLELVSSFACNAYSTYFHWHKVSDLHEMLGVYAHRYLYSFSLTWLRVIGVMTDAMTVIGLAISVLTGCTGKGSSQVGSNLYSIP
jgi:hypothetical protein